MSALEDALAEQFAQRGLSPIQEYRFAPPRRFRFDFAWPEERLAVEVDGGSWAGGRHTRGSGFARDCEKSALAAIGGWRVVHVTGAHIKSGQAIHWAELALRLDER